MGDLSISYTACLLLFPVNTWEKQNCRDSREYEYDYKCASGLVSERRPRCLNLGKNSSLSSTIAKPPLPEFLTVLKARALEEVPCRDENFFFLLCFCFSQRPADLERSMVASDKNQKVYPLMPGIQETHLSFQCFPLGGNLLSQGLAWMLRGQGARGTTEETSFFITQAGEERIEEEEEEAIHDWVLINYQSWQWQECEKQSTKVKKKKKKKRLYSLLHRK